MHPPTFTRRLVAPLKQPASSPSGGLPRSAPPGLVQAPPSLATASQYSKWPISSEKLTLYVCAAHGTRVCSLDDEYIGRKAYGDSVQVAAAGSKLIWANWFASLAVIEPAWRALRSAMSTRSPSRESRMFTAIWSPEPMNRSVAALGVNVAVVAASGLGGAWGLPFFVMNAKLAGSIPARARQSALFTTPRFWSCDRLKMAIAAHHLVASQEMAFTNGTQPGGENCTSRKAVPGGLPM